jgi:hypothetical protein
MSETMTTNAAPVSTPVPTPAPIAASVETPVVPSAPLPDLAAYKPVQEEMAGEIVEVSSTGCYVKTVGDTSVFLPYQKGMTDSYTPKVGDYWVVYANGYAFISPRQTFQTGHGMDVTPVSDDVDPNAEPNFPHYIRFETGGTDDLEMWVKSWVTWKIAHPGKAESTPATTKTSSTTEASKAA